MDDNRGLMVICDASQTILSNHYFTIFSELFDKEMRRYVYNFHFHVDFILAFAVSMVMTTSTFYN